MKYLLFCLLPILSWGQYSPGTSYFNSNNYVEYIAGDLPIVLSIPHGGYLKPSAIPDRSCSGCVYVNDSYTQVLGRAIANNIYQRSGCYPHVVINLLHRSKLDANRSITTAADGNVEGETAWYAYHEFIDSAKAVVSNDYGAGLFIDFHGHAHTIQRLELGYLLRDTVLQLADSLVDTFTASSIQHLVQTGYQGYTQSELIRGMHSLGTLCANQGFPSVPSSSMPFPLPSEPYFRGGYNTERHGSIYGGTIDAIQIECNRDIRFDSLNRVIFADSLAGILLDYMELHYFPNFSLGYCNTITATTKVKVLPIQSYPNPTENRLFIQAMQYPLEVEVYNSLGQSVLNATLRSSIEYLDVSTLTTGTYWVICRSNQGLHPPQKIIKGS